MWVFTYISLTRLNSWGADIVTCHYFSLRRKILKPISQKSPCDTVGIIHLQHKGSVAFLKSPTKICTLEAGTQ